MFRARSLAAALVVASGLVGRRVVADEAFGPRPRDAGSVFFIARSTNKNQVHYGVRLDGACNVLGDKPVFGYWRMLQNHGEIEPILGMEQPAYGIDDRQEILRGPAATTIRFKLRAFPDRPLAVTIGKTQSGCEAIASTGIAGTEAQLRSIYVKVKWPFGIDYVLVRGLTKEGRPVEEWLQN